MKKLTKLVLLVHKNKSLWSFPKAPGYLWDDNFIFFTLFGYTVELNRVAYWESK